MKRELLVLTALVFSVACVFSMVGAADAPENIEMNSPVFKKHKKALVTLSHTKHAKEYKIACADCHHVYKDGKNTWKEGDKVQKCTECHKKAKAPKAKKDEPKMAKADKIKEFYYSAIHENCVACHKAEKKKGKKAPSACKDCHPKPKK
jgi:hypothetical protein